MIKILVSKCLLGEDCKYNGGNNFREFLVNIQDKVEFIPVCPEVMGGLPTPRIPSEIRGNKVFNEIDLEVTRNYLEGASKILEIAKKNKVKYAIFKERSPSCGVHNIYDGSFNHKTIKGKGITTRLLQENGIKVYSDEDIEELIKNKNKLKNF